MLPIIKKASFDQKNECIQLIRKYDSSFSPPLSSRVDLEAYVDKIFSLGFPLIVEFKRKIVGICFFYANDFVNGTSFLSLILLDVSYRNNATNISEKMLGEWFKVAKELGMKSLELEVSAEKLSLINWYKSHGFKEKLRFYRNTFDALILVKYDF